MNAGHRAMFANGRMKTGQMNKLEGMYSAHLNERLMAGEILWFKFEGLKLRLADLTFLTVDFFVMDKSGQLSAHEVKGFMQDDAHVKLKVAAELYPFPFYLVKAKAKKDGGGFTITDI